MLLGAVIVITSGVSYLNRSIQTDLVVCSAPSSPVHGYSPRKALLHQQHLHLSLAAHGENWGGRTLCPLVDEVLRIAIARRSNAAMTPTSEHPAHPYRLRI